MEDETDTEEIEIARTFLRRELLTEVSKHLVVKLQLLRKLASSDHR